MKLSLHTQQHRLRAQVSFHVRQTAQVTHEDSDLVPDVLSAGLCLYAEKGTGKSTGLGLILGHYEDRYIDEGTGQIAFANMYVRELWPKQRLGLFPICMAGDPKGHVHTEDCVMLYELRRCDKYMWDWIVKAAPVTCGLLGLDEAADVWPIWGVMSNRMRDATTELRGLRHRQLDLICGTTHPERLGSMASEQIEFYGLVEAGERPSRWLPPRTITITIYRFDGSPLPRQYTEAGALASTEIEIPVDWWRDKADPPFASWSKMSPHWQRQPAPAGESVEQNWRVIEPEGAALEYEQWSPLHAPEAVEIEVQGGDNGGI